MSVQRFTFPATFLGLLSFVVPLSVGQDAKDEPKPKDKQVIDSRPEKRKLAAGVNFKKELGLPYPSLGTLGARIDSARRQSDPVSLGHAASELAVAEKVSGKQATLTSTKLYKEAVQLARLRRDVAELRAMLAMNYQITNAQGEATLLQQDIDQAKQFAQNEKRQIEMNQEPTGPRKLIVNNYTTQYIDVTVNGRLKMQVPPGESRWCMIEHKWNPTVLEGYGNEDLDKWGPKTILGDFKTYTWNING